MEPGQRLTCQSSLGSVDGSGLDTVETRRGGLQYVEAIVLLFLDYIPLGQVRTQVSLAPGTLGTGSSNVTGTSGESLIEFRALVLAL